MSEKPDWRTDRDESLEELADNATRLLLDRAIIGVQAVPHNDSCDSPNVLRLTLDHGTRVDIEGGYGGYSGHSCDEYVEILDVREVPA